MTLIEPTKCFFFALESAPMQPIQLYSWPTTNGHKVHIGLEEMGIPYEAHPVNIERGEQHAPAFLAVSPNNKIPAILDPEGPGEEGLALFESSAILLYLAEKSGQLLPSAPAERYATLQWLMFQTAGIGPSLGVAHHYRYFAPVRIDYAIDRATNEARRLYAVIDKQLRRHRYIAGANFTIADIAIFPWLRQWDRQGIEWSHYPHVFEWFERVGQRPGVQRGVAVLADWTKHMAVPVNPPVPLDG